MREEKGGVGSSAWPFPVRGGNSGHFGGGVGASHRCARQLEGCGWDLRLGGAGKPCQARCARHKMPKRLLEQKLHLRNNTAINLSGENYHNMKSGSWHVLEFSTPELLCNASVFSPWVLCAGSSLIWIANSKGSLRSLKGDEGIWGHVTCGRRPRNLIYGEVGKSKYSNIRTRRSRSKVLFELYLRWSLQTVSNFCILSTNTPELNQVALLCLWVFVGVCDPPNDQACDKKAWMVGNTPELNWVDWIAASRCQDWRLARKPACPLHRWIGPINRRSWPHLVKYSWNI